MKGEQKVMFQSLTQEVLSEWGVRWCRELGDRPELGDRHGSKCDVIMISVTKSVSENLV